MRTFSVAFVALTFVFAAACGDSDEAPATNPSDGGVPGQDSGSPSLPVDAGADAPPDAAADADGGPTYPTRSYARAWTFTFSSTARSGLPGQSSAEGVKTIALDDAANIYVGAGGWNVASATSVDDWWLRKLDPAGNEVLAGWDKIIDASMMSGELPRVALKRKDGSILFAGQIGTEPNASYADHVTFRCYAADGAEVTSWASYQAIGEYTNRLAESPDGSLYALTYEKADAFAGTTRIRRFDTTGAVDPSFLVAYTGVEHVLTVAVDADGNVFTGGVMFKTGLDTTSKDAFVRKYDSSGALVWSHPFTLPNAGTVPYLLISGDDVIAFAVDDGTPQTQRTVMPFKIARADGAARQEAWQPYSYTGALFAVGAPPVLDADGNIEALVAEGGNAPTYTSTFRLRRFAPNGTTLSISTPLVETYYVNGFAMTASGDVVLAGDGGVVGHGNVAVDTGFVVKVTPSP